MSVRDELDTYLDCQGFSPMSRQKVQWFMADYAHELAEEIREASLGMYPTGLCPAIAGSRQAANLIDPYVSTPEYLIETTARHLAEWKAAEG